MSLIQQNLMSVALVFLCFMVSLAKPAAHSLSAVIWTVPCFQPILLRAVMIWQPDWLFTKAVPISASAADTTMGLRMLTLRRTAPLMSGGGIVGIVAALFAKVEVAACS